MRITLNGESKEVSNGCTVFELVAQMNLLKKRYAVEINQQIIPKSQHAEYRLNPADRVEIVHAIGGG